ncbi:MAG: sensor histidine kinase [Eubacteriales bacterium]|nr:sensor histidine kinase [Eubacteriales bacterium]MDD3883030.1 sensor histidine kinase [Eubacteriales bacterium]MDD4513643.1 sensor histidine kinase [Eubacteriales bacterium]
MKKNKALLLITGYIRYAWRCALTLLVSPAVFIAIQLLGGVDFYEMRYALYIIAAIYICAAAYSFSDYTKKQVMLWNALDNLPSDESAYPEGRGGIEESYRELALRFKAENEKTEDDARLASARELDYYTLWMHQIKTPISVIDLMAQSRGDIERSLLRQEVFRIEQYVEAVLSYQRLASIGEDMQLENVDIAAVIRASVKKLRPLFMYREISLSLQPFSFTALSDSKWLSFVITQILSNSLKYTGKGGRISITSPEDGILEIADTGIGIRPEDVPQVFSRGFTGSLGRENEKSTGIGLYLCKQVMDRLSHRISLSSVFGEGTKVTLDLRREELKPF